MKIIFATHNQHKVDEVRMLLKDLKVNLKSLSDLDMQDEIVEDGATMKDNAWIKANYIYKRYQGNVIADDSGLEIDALDGRPGVHSARFAGEHKNSDDNIDKVLKLLDGEENRKARFRAILAAWINDNRYTFEGTVEGHIAHERTGSGGFGYDPIFIPEGYEKSFGALSEEIKNNISHRANCLEKFKKMLKKTPKK